MKNSLKSLLACVVLVFVASAQAFPTKVTITKNPDLASSEGAQVVAFTNKGTVTVSSKYPAYKILANSKKGECYILETDSESVMDFNKKTDRSEVSTVKKTRCIN